MGAGVCRWIMGAASSLAGVSGCRVQASVWMVRRRVAGCISIAAVGVGQTALDGELKELVVGQVTVERIILKAQRRSC